MEKYKSNSIHLSRNNECFKSLNSYLEQDSKAKIFVLIDENTKQFCLPILNKYLNHEVTPIQIPSGEVYKNLETCQLLWQNLIDKGADRYSILLNLGGGVITDMGGFVAATYKRGIRFINIPTSLLAMVDAAIGGKTGVDFKHLKNQIGIFVPPEMTLIYPEFLKTLVSREMRSGLAEVIKYGLIDNASIWEYIQKMDANSFEIDPSIIQESVAIKEKIVEQDPTEKGIRKSLNFGHTLGHAIETYFLSKTKSEKLLHGEAIAAGMILAASLSSQTIDFPEEKTREIAMVIRKLYAKVSFTNTDIKAILDLLQHDKKNINGQLNFVLLKAIGKPVLDCHVRKQDIRKAFDFYESFD